MVMIFDHTFEPALEKTRTHWTMVKLEHANAQVQRRTLPTGVTDTWWSSTHYLDEQCLIQEQVTWKVK